MALRRSPPRPPPRQSLFPASPQAASLPYLLSVITQGGRPILASRALAPVVLARGRERAEIPLKGFDDCGAPSSVIHDRSFAIVIGTGALRLPASAFRGIPNLLNCGPSGSAAPLGYGPYWPSWGFVYNATLGPLAAGARGTPLVRDPVTTPLRSWRASRADPSEAWGRREGARGTRAHGPTQLLLDAARFGSFFVIGRPSTPTTNQIPPLPSALICPGFVSSR